MATWNYNLTVGSQTLIFQVTTPNPIGTEPVTATSISGTVDGQPITGLLGPGAFLGNDDSLSTVANGYFDGIDYNGIAFTYKDSSNQQNYR